MKCLSGKGSIFVWASGTGGRYHDDCNYDGYQSSINTVSISSVNDEGVPAWYAEHCAPAFAVTYSNGDKRYYEEILHHTSSIVH